MNAGAQQRFHPGGLGQVGRGTQLGVNIGTVAAQGGAAAAVSAAGGLTVAGAFLPAAVAIPVVGVAIAAIGLGIMAILNSGCGQTCIETSQWANQAEPLLQQNVVAYFAIAAPRPASVQLAAVQNFMSVWNRLVQLCTQPGLGNAGKNCIADRQSGACKWRATATGAYPGQPAQGQCWNWWNAYHDPIANDTQTYNDSIVSAGTTNVSGTASSTSVSSTSVPSNSDLLVIAGAALVGLLMVSQL